MGFVMNMKWFIVCGLAVSILLVIFVSPLASGLPDGLEWVAGKLGFVEKAEGKPAVKAPMREYECPLVDARKHPTLAKGLSGLAGMLVVFFVTLGAAQAMKARKKRSGNDGSGPGEAPKNDPGRR
jgi:hypothetical protein